MITLYWAPQTRAARMFWALEEVGQPYEPVHVDIRTDGAIRPSGFDEASPLGKVPALADGDVRVADSAAIALYLADRYAPGVLAPGIDDAERGAFLFWLFYTPSAMEPAMTEKFVKMPPNPTAYPWGSFDRMMGALETRLRDRDWLAADRFTMADFMVSGTIDYMRRFGMLEPSPVLSSYADRCLARPAAIRGREKEAAATAALRG